jgi:hypothetical protein
MTIEHSFVKRANTSMSKIDQLLKTLQVRPSPPEALVQAYLIHIGDRSEANFRKILELKGIRKQDQASLIDLFNAHCGSPNYANLPASSPILTPLNILAATQSAGAMAGLKEKSQTFDAATFGSALMNAAREGVDRFGSPSLGVGTMGSAAAAGHGRTGSGDTVMSTVGDGVTAAGLNENLKNIGKFFRRDVGGVFGRSISGAEGKS